MGRAGPIAGIKQAVAPAEKSGETAISEAPLAELENLEPAKAANQPVANEEAQQVPTGPVPTWKTGTGGQLGFTVTVNGEQVAGRFSRWSSKIVFDPERLGKSSIRTSIDLSSVATGDGERDSMLVGSDFFATAAHPQAVFTSADIRSIGGNRYRASGTLSLKGVSRPVRLDFTLDIKGNRATSSGSATLSRRAFGVGSGQFEGDDTIGTSVTVNFNFNATRQ